MIMCSRKFHVSKEKDVRITASQVHLTASEFLLTFQSPAQRTGLFINRLLLVTCVCCHVLRASYHRPFVREILNYGPESSEIEFIVKRGWNWLWRVNPNPGIQPQPQPAHFLRLLFFPLINDSDWFVVPILFHVLLYAGSKSNCLFGLQADEPPAEKRVSRHVMATFCSQMIAFHCKELSNNSIPSQCDDALTSFLVGFHSSHSHATESGSLHGRSVGNELLQDSLIELRLFDTMGHNVGTERVGKEVPGIQS